MTTEIVVQEQNELALNGPSAVEFEASLVEAQQKATAMKRMISAHDWSVNIGGNEHIKNEAWVTLAGAYGCTASIVSTERIPGYKQAFVATAEVLRQTPNGVVSIGRADAECGTDGDGRWESKQPAFAVRSMAQTRAISKAIASVFRWVVVLAGYAGTPYEDMPDSSSQRSNEASQYDKAEADRRFRPATASFGAASGGGSRPASGKQIDYLKSLGYQGDDAELLTSQEASRQIEQLKNQNTVQPASSRAPAVKKEISLNQFKRQVQEYARGRNLTQDNVEFAIGHPLDEYFQDGKTFDDAVEAIELVYPLNGQG